MTNQITTLSFVTIANIWLAQGKEILGYTFLTIAGISLVLQTLNG